MTPGYFIFQEVATEPYLYLVRLFEEEEEPDVFRFKLPSAMIEGQVGMAFDERSKRLVIPPEKKKKTSTEIDLSMSAKGLLGDISSTQLKLLAEEAR